MAITEIVVLGLVVYALAGDYIRALVEQIEEDTRSQRLINDRYEFGDHNDEEAH